MSRISARYTVYGDDHDYELPHGNMDFEDTLVVLRGIPRANLEKIVNTAWIGMSDYENENKRRKYLASHLVANERGLAAPAFRSLLRQRSHDRLSEVEQVLSRDRQLIDLHYLHCHHRHELKFREYDNTVDFLRWGSKEFDYEAASQFACIGARKFIKTEKMLAIPEHVQMKLNFYQTDKVRKHVERANEKCQEVCAELNSYFMSSRSRLTPSKKDKLTSDLLPLLLARGDVSLGVDIKLSMLGHEANRVASASYSASLSDSKRWFKNWKKGLV